MGKSLKSVCREMEHITAKVWCSPLNPYLFSQDKLAKGIEDKASWCIMFADDVVILDENKEVLDGKLEHWRKMD